VNTKGFINNSFNPTPGLIGASRNNPSTYDYRAGGTTKTEAVTTATSDPPFAADLFVFARNDGGPQFHADSTIPFYSIGEAVDLALLDARVSQLMTDLDGAIA